LIIVSKCKQCGKALKHTKASNLEVHLKLHQNAYTEYKEKKKSGGNLGTSERAGEVKTVEIKTSVTELNQICVELVTKNGRPFSIVKDSALTRLIKPLYNALGETPMNVPKLEIQIHEQTESIRLRDEIRNQLISIKIDVATRFDRGFLGVSVQFTKQNDLKIRSLGIIELKKKSYIRFFGCRP
jgi:hypothetical protein